MKTARPSLRSMMIASLILAAVSFTWGASSPGQETAPTGTSTNGVAGGGAKQRRTQLPFAKGTLLANDLLRRMLKLKTQDGIRTFTYTERTYIFRGKEKITPDKLVVGETIALRFYTDNDGRVLVRRIKVYGTVQPAGTKSSDATGPAK